MALYRSAKWTAAYGLRSVLLARKSPDSKKRARGQVLVVLEDASRPKFTASLARTSPRARMQRARSSDAATVSFAASSCDAPGEVNREEAKNVPALTGPGRLKQSERTWHHIPAHKIRAWNFAAPIVCTSHELLSLLSGHGACQPTRCACSVASCRASSSVCR